MDDRDRQELERLRDKLLEIMRANEVAHFDEAARQRIGAAIGRAARQGRSDYAYGSPR